MLTLSRFARPKRSREWTEAKAVTFIVTLAARRSVTLAARAAGMSRKAAYALRGRDSAFAEAWKAAGAAGIEGDKVSEARDPPIAMPKGDSARQRMSLEQFHELLSRWRSESNMALLAPGMTLP